ncbi:MAG: tyrosine-protein phosphatase [Tannerella sp.]|nr:tyrosine-protein phosphatase [Tannerella sp.]
MNEKIIQLSGLLAAFCSAAWIACSCDELVSHRRAGIMEGAPNFRDLGGYRSGNGKQTTWGKVFRAQALDRLSDRDVEQMRELGIKTVIDFRDDVEVGKAPSRLPQGVRTVRLPIAVGSHASEAMRQMIRPAVFDSLQCVRFMEEANRLFVTEFAAQYRAFFEVLLEAENYPVVFHCTAGKDRTGFAAAMLLGALDVDWNTVMEDYMLTNDCLQLPPDVLPEQDSSALRLIWRVQPSYLNAARDEIVARYGSIDNYLQQELLVEKAERERLKFYLLE